MNPRSGQQIGSHEGAADARNHSFHVFKAIMEKPGDALLRWMGILLKKELASCKKGFCL